MADSAEAGGDAQITFKVKTSTDGLHTITMSESATVLDLKTKLATGDFENIPVERQRLIYSGRVMKNDDTLGSYKIKSNNTIHMVKSAASNSAQTASTSTLAPTPPAVPSNMASGTANNPLAGLTGARYAGQQVHLPNMDAFGPDGGMGIIDEDRLQRLMSDPNVQQSMSEALNNPDFVNMLIDSNPMLRNLPNARELITSPFMREMMGNPQMVAQAMRMQRHMRGGNAAFPAPGATDTTPEGAAAHNGASAGQADNNSSSSNNNNNNSQQQNPFLNPFMPPGMMGNGAQLSQLLQTLGTNPFAAPPSTNNSQTGSTATTENREAAGGGLGAGQSQNAANPFAALFPPIPGSQGAAYGLNPQQLQQMLQMLGGEQAVPQQTDNRPPEERYAEQLRQLNDMGFYDFDRNVAALRRSGGSVQGAIEHLLSATD